MLTLIGDNDALLLEAQKLLKRPSKVQVEDGVDDGVEGGINVAQPCHKVCQFFTGTA